MIGNGTPEVSIIRVAHCKKSFVGHVRTAKAQISLRIHLCVQMESKGPYSAHAQDDLNLRILCSKASFRLTWPIFRYRSFLFFILLFYSVMLKEPFFNVYYYAQQIVYIYIFFLVKWWSVECLVYDYILRYTFNCLNTEGTFTEAD